jgi:hypothetical protein
LQLWAQSVNPYYFLDVLTIAGAHIEVQSKVSIASIAAQTVIELHGSDRKYLLDGKLMAT